MKLFEELTADNFELFATKHYDNPSCIDVEEFRDDLKRFKYIVRLLNRYKETGLIQERLVLNHIIILYNVFTISACNRMMFYRIPTELWGCLKPFLLFLNYIPENQFNDVGVDITIAKKLQNI